MVVTLGNRFAGLIHCGLGHRSARLAYCVGQVTAALTRTHISRSRYAGKSLPSRLDSLIGTTAPGVTIIRPICGLDNNLYNALEAAMKLDYPNYEIIFALQDEHDEALPVVRLIMEKYSAVDAKIIIGMFGVARR